MILTFFNDLLLSLLRKCKLAREEEKEAEVDEKLGTYVQCLGRRNRQMWRIDEQDLRQEFGIKTISDSMLSKLKVNQPHNKTIRTCHNYEIVTNSKYAQAF